MSEAVKLPQPTHKQALWFSCYTDKGNKKTYLNSTQSALFAYDTTDYNTARQIGVDNKKLLAPLVEHWLQEEGLSPAALKSKLISLTKAKKTKFMKVKGIVGKDDLKPGQRIVCKSSEETLLALDVENKELQRSALDLAFKVEGVVSEDKGGDTHINITNYGAPQNKELDDLKDDPLFASGGSGG